MTYLITLYLSPPNNTLEFVQTLPWAKELTIDAKYGLVSISPAKNLYTIRTKTDLDLHSLRDRHPEIIRGVYGDVRIQPFLKDS